MISKSLLCLLCDVAITKSKWHTLGSKYRQLSGFTNEVLHCGAKKICASVQIYPKLAQLQLSIIYQQDGGSHIEVFKFKNPSTTPSQTAGLGHCIC
jgi:hypothetical protein